MKINMACGLDYKQGWTNLDKDPRIKADVYFDLNTLQDGVVLPFETDSVEEIVANHIVEHLDVRAFIPFMNECRRVLQHGSSMHIETPSPLCEWFWQDPTHVRGYTRNTFAIYFITPTFATYGIDLWSWADTVEIPSVKNSVGALTIIANMRK
jgi:predicted SAM-dependent methyltransferase